MKRRGFLGSLLGAAAAGPSVAKSIARDATLTRSGGISARTLLKHSAYDGYAGCDPIPENTDWRLSEIANLQRRLTGGKSPEQLADEEERRLRNQYSTIDESVDCLRSMSRQSKLRLVYKRHREHSDRVDEFSLRRQLASLMKEVGL